MQINTIRNAILIRNVVRLTVQINSLLMIFKERIDMLTIYNTLTRKKEEFKPLHPGVVNMYVCGPTVYNYIHIGNARSAIAFDTVRRYLEFKGYKVNYVSNFTDVDDKMIKAAAEQGITVPQLAEKYINAFMDDTAAINIEPATLHPRATENITEIIKFVQGLVEKDMPILKMGMFIIGHESLTTMDSFLDNHLMTLKWGQVNMLVRMRLIRRKIRLILLYGKQLSPAKLVGIHHGEKVVQDGISNVQ